jgi:hypothetical protein
MNKANNRRRYPGVKGRRPDNKEHKRAEAVARQTAYAVLSAEQKVERLNLGGFMAEKQRSKLYKELANV